MPLCYRILVFIFISLELPTCFAWNTITQAYFSFKISDLNLHFWSHYPWPLLALFLLTVRLPEAPFQPFFSLVLPDSLGLKPSQHKGDSVPAISFIPASTAHPPPYPGCIVRAAWLPVCSLFLPRDCVLQQRVMTQVRQLGIHAFQSQLKANLELGIQLYCVFKASFWVL